MKKDIQARTDYATKDIAKGENIEQLFNFPSLGVSVMAKTMDEALIMAKEVIKNKK